MATRCMARQNILRLADRFIATNGINFSLSLNNWKAIMCMALNLIACAVRLHALECELFIIIVVLLLPLFKVLVAVAHVVICLMKILEVMTNLVLF